MGTTRIKVIDLSSTDKEIKTSRKRARLASSAKRAEKLAGVAKLKEEKPQPKTGRPLDEKLSKAAREQDAPKKIKEETLPPQQAEPSPPSPPSQPSKSQKIRPLSARQKHHLGKKYQKAKGLVDQNKLYSISEALALLPQTSITKFDASVETHINVADKKLKGKVKLPHPPTTAPGQKQEKKYLVFGEKLSPKAAAGTEKNIIWGDEKTIEEIASGKLKPKKNFDTVIATSKFMPKIAIIAKILGPLGLMPNPKNGTVVDNNEIAAIEKALLAPSDDSFEFKSDPTAAIIHCKLGKVSTKAQELEENLKALYLAIGPTKVKKIVVTTTMGPSIKIDPATVNLASGAQAR